jgi:predicted small metal-binding protein
MNYDHRNPVLSLRLGESRHGKLTKLANAKKKPVIDYLREDIIDALLDGKLIEKIDDDFTIKMNNAKYEKITLENKLTQIKINYFENFGKEINSSSQRILSRKLKAQNLGLTPVNVELSNMPQSPYDESNHRLQCIDCGSLFTWHNTDEYLNQIKEFANHIRARHNRQLNTIELDVIDNLTYTGNSK